MLASDVRTRTLELVRAIAESMSAEPSSIPSESDSQTLVYVEAIARKQGILPPIPRRDMSTVTTSIGTTGRDYSTITAWEADLDNSGIYSASDVAIGECYNDSAFDEEFTIDGGGTVGLGSVVLSVASGERHDGTPGSGARIVRTGTNSNIVHLNEGRDCTVQWLEIDGNEVSNLRLLYMQSSGNVNAIATNCLVHSNHATGATKVGVGIAGGGGASSLYSFQNSFLFNVRNDLGRTAGTVYGITEGTSRPCSLLNCTIGDVSAANTSGAVSGVDFGDDAVNTIKNVISGGHSNGGAGAVTAFLDSNYTTADAATNMADDTTASGTDSIDSAALSDQVVSTTRGSEDYHLKTGADAINAGTDIGTTPSGVEIDIDGRDRDAEGDTWDIGAHEYVAVAGGNAPTSLFYGPFVGSFGGPI